MNMWWLIAITCIKEETVGTDLQYRWHLFYHRSFKFSRLPVSILTSILRLQEIVIAKDFTLYIKELATVWQTP